MSRQAGFAEAQYEVRGERLMNRVNHIAGLPSTEKWAVSRDWTCVLRGGPRDGSIRRLPVILYASLAPDGYAYTAFTKEGAFIEDIYTATGYAPYQRVVFMDFVERRAPESRPMTRTFRDAKGLRKLMEQDGDL